MKTTAQDIMSTELITIREGSTLEEALKLLINNRITGLPVVNKSNQMVGILSEYDIMTQMADVPDSDAQALKAPVAFTRGAASISPGTSLREVVSVFLKFKYRRLPVVDKRRKLIGIVTRRDLMKVFYYRARVT